MTADTAAAIRLQRLRIQAVLPAPGALLAEVYLTKIPLVVRANTGPRQHCEVERAIAQPLTDPLPNAVMRCRRVSWRRSSSRSSSAPLHAAIPAADEAVGAECRESERSQDPQDLDERR